MGSRIVGIALIALFGCSKDSAPPAQKLDKPAASRPKPTLNRALLVGTLARGGDRVCRVEGDDSWINVHYEVGFVPIIVPDGQRIPMEALIGKPVVVYGTVADDAPARTEQPPAGAVKCPEQQWRSDWVRGPDGVRSRRNDGPGIAAFTVGSVEPFSGLGAVRKGDEIHVELENTLKQPLAAPVELVVYYEGCYGKPGVRTETVAAQAGLEPGKSLSGDFPTITTDRGDPALGGRRGKGAHTASSVEIRAKGENVYFDVDVPLFVYGGIAVDCPKQ